MRVLVSVRDTDEALLAARAGVSFIDLKEPSHGALGGLPVETIAAVVQALRRERTGLLLSATIGEFAASALGDITAQVRRVAACGVDHVKVGVQAGLAAPALVRQLTALQHEGLSLVPVLIADEGVPPDLVRLAAQGGFAAVMMDTQDKRAGCLFDLMAHRDLASFVAQVRDGGAMAGLSGALRLAHLPTLAALAPDFAGFRSAVCHSSREAALDAGLLQPLLAAMHATVTADTAAASAC